MSLEVKQAFTDAELPPPAIPDRWAASLRERGTGLFATGDLPRYRPSNFDTFVEVTLAGMVSCGLIVGADGYGINNQALHYYLIEEDLLLLLQWRYGNAYDDKAESVNAICHGFGVLSQLLQQFDRVRAQGVALPGRLTVLAGGRQSRWAFVPKLNLESVAPEFAMPPSFYVTWQESEDPLTAALEELRGL